jgi:hypothetical protein
MLLAKSPFPGMDPWLERHWGDIHASIITYARDQLQEKLPPGLRARMQERVFVEIPDDDVPRQVVYPDLRVVERAAGSSTIETVAVLDAAEPLIVQLQNEPVTESYIEIVEAGSGHRVITTIEVLSRANKSGREGQDLYRQKQRECREAKVNLVEIDLLRWGRRILIAPPESIPRERRATYQASVWRAARPTVAEVYPIPLRQPLPAIRIPLRPTDADVRLDLQPLIEQTYRNGGYDDIDYKTDPEPALDADDAEWAAQPLRERGLR